MKSCQQAAHRETWLSLDSLRLSVEYILPSFSAERASQRPVLCLVTASWRQWPNEQRGRTRLSIISSPSFVPTNETEKQPEQGLQRDTAHHWCFFFIRTSPSLSHLSLPHLFRAPFTLDGGSARQKDW